MARIRKHRNKWQVLYRDPNTKKERSAGVFERKSDANRVRDSIAGDIATGRWIEPERLGSSMSLSDWWQQIEPTWLRRGDSTRSRDTSYFGSLIEPYLGSQTLSSIDSLALEKWIADLDGSGYSPATIAKAKQLVRRALQEAMEKDLLAKNPAANMKGKLPAIEPYDPRVIEPAEAHHLADAIDDRYRAFTLVAFYTGARWGETAAIRRSRIKLRRGTVTIDGTLGRDLTIQPPKTKLSRRTVHLPDPLDQVLRVHLDRHYQIGNEPNLVFTSSEGRPIRYTNWRSRIWIPATQRAGFEGLRFHDLRHSHASYLIDAGIDAERVARRLGHAHTSMTLDRYTHLIDTDEEAILQALNRPDADRSRTTLPLTGTGSL